MADLVVIVPSRGRPDAAAELLQVFRETCQADTALMLALDSDDPKLDAYPTGPFRYVGLNQSMVQALNGATPFATGWHTPFAVGFMGDDHRPRTRGWDQAYLDALRELGTGIVYGNDQLQGERIPTQVAMTADIVRALGHMAPPTLTHLYVDNYWRDLGIGAGCLRYLPDVIVEHMHPIAGKAEWDEGHRRVNSQEMYVADQARYAAYWASHLAEDVAKVKALRS